jgi:hypothetical protein
MKTRVAILAAMLLAAGVVASCEEKVTLSNEKQTLKVTNLKGTVYFNEDIQEWYIFVHKEDTYDEAQLFFPSNLDNAYKVPNLKIIFSGTISDLKTNITVPAGTTCFSIEISFIANNLN